MPIVRQPPHARQRSEELERASLSTWAALAAESKGRDRYEEPDPLRTAFQQDRDRIATAHAFTSLSGKTEHLVVAPVSPRSRLTHTLEVWSTARTIGRGLRLNEDLIEAVALGHALGEPAFGPAGAAAITAVADLPFRSTEQAVRIVEHLEGDGRGLNLTWEARDGILHADPALPPPATAEAQVVRLAVAVVRPVGALLDALADGTVRWTDLPADVSEVGRAPHVWRRELMRAVVAGAADQPEVHLPEPYAILIDGLDRLVTDRTRTDERLRAEHDRAEHCLRSLLVYHLHHPTGLSARGPEDATVPERVLDHVVGLTDAGARHEFTSRFAPRSVPHHR
jgi:dGTPase